MEDASPHLNQKNVEGASPMCANGNTSQHRKWLADRGSPVHVFILVLLAQDRRQLILYDRGWVGLEGHEAAERVARVRPAQHEVCGCVRVCPHLCRECTSRSAHLTMGSGP